MAEVRRKLVIVGDGACGKVRISQCFFDEVDAFVDMSFDRVFERTIPGGTQLYVLSCVSLKMI